jgi:hypothetical protein
VSSIERYNCGCELDSGEEIAGSFVTAGCDGAALLEFCKEIHDQVARFILRFRLGGMTMAMPAAMAGTSIRLSASPFFNGVGSSFVGNNRCGNNTQKQCVGTVKIIGLSVCQGEG